MVFGIYDKKLVVLKRSGDFKGIGLIKNNVCYLYIVFICVPIFC